LTLHNSNLSTHGPTITFQHILEVLKRHIILIVANFGKFTKIQNLENMSGRMIKFSFVQIIKLTIAIVENSAKPEFLSVSEPERLKIDQKQEK
jgi:hypothetical protein